MRRYDLLSSVPYEHNLSIDNTKLSATKVAALIAEHYSLVPAARVGPVQVKGSKRVG